MLIGSCEVQSLKNLLLQRLRVKPLPYGAKFETHASLVVDAYLDHGELDRVQHLMRRCEPEFLRAFRTIIRYTPQLSGNASRKNFRAFLTHRRTFPHFYKLFCSFVEEAEEKGIRGISATTVANRVIWETGVVRKESKLRGLNSNIIAHYADYWTLDHPHLNFRFKRRNANGFQRRRDFAINADLDME